MATSVECVFSFLFARKRNYINKTTPWQLLPCRHPHAWQSGCPANEKPQTLLFTRICIGVNCAITSICQLFLSGCVVPLWSFWHAGNEFFLTEWNWPSCGSAGEWCLLLPGCERALCGPSFFTSYQKVHASGGTCHPCCHLIFKNT